MSSEGSWWRSAVVYQVYLRSFADGGGDGVGDLPGLRSRLPYLRSLGVDALWITPHYRSPQEDHGYDVADHRSVDPLFGTLADLDALVQQAHAGGLRVLLDLVPNHTSSADVRFVEALRSPPGSAARARYLFRDGRGEDGSLPPNNWQSTFGGPAWERVVEADGRPGQWYLHLFAPGQPDLDWRNPQVVEDMHRTLRFWLDRGVDGFRVDVAHGLVKRVGLPDDPRPTPPGTAYPLPDAPMWDQPEVHDIYRDWRTLVDGYDGDRVLVGELWVRDPVRHAAYVRPDELHLAFAFPLLTAPLTAADWRTAITASLAATAGVGSPATWFLGNHDVTRAATRLGGLAQSRAAHLTMLALPGPVFLYAGDELGLPEVEVPPEARQDPMWERSRHTYPGRDGCRVPLPWSGTTPPFGFTTAAQAWLPQPAEWSALTVQAQDGSDPAAADAVPRSTLDLLRRALRLRGEHLQGRLAWRDDLPDQVLGFDRPDGPSPLTCLLNTGPVEAEIPLGRAGEDGLRLLLASGPVTLPDGTLRLPPATAAWVAASRTAGAGRLAPP